MYSLFLKGFDLSSCLVENNLFELRKHCSYPSLLYMTKHRRKRDHISRSDEDGMMIIIQ